MPVVPTATIIAEAAGNGCGVAAFNVITLEHAEAITAAAERANLPVILQISQNAVAFHGHRLGPIAAATRCIAEQARVAVSLHLDHIESVELLHQAPIHGFSSAMYDASLLPYEQNITATRAAVDFGHRHGLWVESELGTVGGKDGAAPLPPHAPGARTQPAEAAEYVQRTGVDALAVAIGSAHAMTTRDANLDHPLLGALRRAVSVPLVLHGSSGVPDHELRRAVAGGIVKVNIGTALNIAYTGAVQSALDPQRSDPRRYLGAAREAMTETAFGFLTLLAR